MKFEKGKERIKLTEKEANTLLQAYDILQGIYDNSETAAGGYADDATDAIYYLINNGEPNTNSDYEIGFVKENKVNGSLFVKIDF